MLTMTKSWVYHNYFSFPEHSGVRPETKAQYYYDVMP